MDLERQGLQIYCKVFTWILLVAAVLPFEFYGSAPIWPWQGLLDASLADALALLAPGLGALALFLLGRRQRVKVGLAAAILVGLLVAWALAGWARLGPHPLRVTGHLSDGLPALFSRSFWLLLVGMAALAAGIRLGARGFLDISTGRPALVDPWPLARGLTALGILSTVLFYLLPYRGSVPLVDLVGGVIELLPRLEDVQGMALLSGHILSIGPLAFALGAIGRLFVRSPGHGGALANFAMGYIAVLCLLVGLRNLPVLPAYTLIHLRSAALILTITVGAGVALAALARGLWFEIPWVFGRLSAVDDMLAAALSSPDPEGSLDRSLAELCPLIRPFVRRRLGLWRVAAAEVPGADQADLSAVIRFLECRWREEQGGEELADARPSGAPSWPFWMRRPWPSAIGIGLAGLALVLGLTAAARPDPGRGWVLGPDGEGMRRLFTEALPQVVLDMTVQGGGYRDRAAYKDLAQLLGELDADHPGLRAGLNDLLAQGARGRFRIHRIRRARDSLNRLLLDQRVPYYVRSRVRARLDERGDLFYLLLYRIQACRRYRLAGTERVFAVLQLERVDPLNVIETYMGMTEEEETFVTVFLERLSFFMGERLQTVFDRQDRVGALARRAVAEMGHPADALDAGVSGGLGRELLEGLIRHELHHRFMGLNPTPPPVLWQILFGFSEDSVRGVTAEVGAYLGEMRYRPAYARLRLALMLDALEGAAGRRGSHGRARVFLIQRILGLPAADPDNLVYWALDPALDRLETISDAEIERQLDAVHAELFGQPAPRFTFVDAFVPPIGGDAGPPGDVDKASR